MSLSPSWANTPKAGQWAWGASGPWDAVYWLEYSHRWNHMGGSEAFDGPYLDRTDPTQVADDYEKALSRWDEPYSDSIWGRHGPWRWYPPPCICDACVGGSGGWDRLLWQVHAEHWLHHSLATITVKPPKVIPTRNHAPRALGVDEAAAERTARYHRQKYTRKAGGTPRKRPPRKRVRAQYPRGPGCVIGGCYRRAEPPGAMCKRCATAWREASISG